jgi:hypothetical protein
MTTWLLPVLTALLGYLGHWTQQALTNRHERQTRDRERALELRVRLRELISYEDEEYEAKGRDQLWQIQDDAALLHNAQLRERVLFDWEYAWNAGVIESDASRRTVFVHFLGDAITCLTAAARGDRLPELSDDAGWLLLHFQRKERHAMSPSESAAMLMEEHDIDPDWEELAFEEWRISRRAGQWRRRLVPYRLRRDRSPSRGVL